MISNRQLVEAARSLVGTRFRHTGRTVDNGVDCVGLILLAFAKCGVEIHAPDAYPPKPVEDLFTPFMYRIAQRLTGFDMMPGHVALFQMGGRFQNKATHIAIISDRGLIHADGYFAAKVIENGFAKSYHRRLCSVWSIPCVTYEQGFNLTT